MSEVVIRIGGRPFSVACQPGEEDFLQSAAKMLDAEASVLVEQLGKMPETQMLLMAGLMLADKTAAIEDKLKKSGGKAKAADPEPGKPEGAVVPEALMAKLAAAAERAETLAEALDGKVAG
jgi:cell division protein ZapA